MISSASVSRQTNRLLLAAALGIAVMCPAYAEPDAAPATAAVSTSDAITALLAERGLLPPSPDTIVQSVRDGASDMVLSAMNFLGVPYRRGGQSADTGFDCSGFTRHVFEMSIGLVLPRRAAEQARLTALEQVKREDLKPGDLVFFNTMRRAFSHVGIYIGDGKFIHSPRSGAKVRIESLREAYWAARFNGGRRAALPEAQAADASSAGPSTP